VGQLGNIRDRSSPPSKMHTAATSLACPRALPPRRPANDSPSSTYPADLLATLSIGSSNYGHGGDIANPRPRSGRVNTSLVPCEFLLVYARKIDFSPNQKPIPKTFISSELKGRRKGGGSEWPRPVHTAAAALPGTRRWVFSYRHGMHSAEPD